MERLGTVAASFSEGPAMLTSDIHALAWSPPALKQGWPVWLVEYCGSDGM